MGSADLNATFYGPVKKVKSPEYENSLLKVGKHSVVVISEFGKIKAYPPMTEE